MRCSGKQETYNWRSVSVVLVLNWNKKTIVAIEIAWNLRTWTEGFCLFLFSQRGVNGHVPVLIAVSAMRLLLSQQKRLVRLEKFTIPPSLRNKSKIKFTIFNTERSVNYKLYLQSWKLKFTDSDVFRWLSGQDPRFRPLHRDLSYRHYWGPACVPSSALGGALKFNQRILCHPCLGSPGVL